MIFIQDFFKHRIDRLILCNILITAFPARKTPFSPFLIRADRICRDGCILSGFYFLHIQDCAAVHKCYLIGISSIFCARADLAFRFIYRMETGIGCNIFRIRIPSFKNVDILAVRRFFRGCRFFSFPSVLYCLCA